MILKIRNISPILVTILLSLGLLSDDFLKFFLSKSSATYNVDLYRFDFLYTLLLGLSILIFFFLSRKNERYKYYLFVAMVLTILSMFTYAIVHNPNGNFKVFGFSFIPLFTIG